MKVLSGVFGFIFKIYIVLVFTLTLLLYYLPIQILKLFHPSKKKTFTVFRLWSWSFRILTCIHVHCVEKCEIPKGPYIIVSNHVSYLDIFLMYSIIPNHPFLFLGKSEILYYPLVKSFFKDLNIPVFRNDRIKAAKSFIAARTAIEQGWSLVIFPEGGIPDEAHPKMVPFKDGAFKLAKSCKVPIIPITFTNNYNLFSDPSHFLGPARPGISKVYVHEAISATEIEHLEVNQLSEKVFEIISRPLQS